ncbi:MAG: outer membrane beta-barrel protein [Silvanigrellaceae bacterium]|nr:outer membrane beta-barrel protein [Silvanigrellaceae bacterium]
MKKNILLMLKTTFFLANFFLLQTNILAQDVKEKINKEDISPLLKIEDSETVSLPGSLFSFGIYRESIQPPSNQYYKEFGLGVSIGFYQHIRGIWSGGLELRWSDWGLSDFSKQENGLSATQSRPIKYSTMSPLSIFSKIEASPHFPNFNESSYQKIFRPYVTAGLGFVTFLANRSISNEISKLNKSQSAVTLGGGLKIILTKVYALNLSFEYWRGVNTYSYAALVYMLTFQFGDTHVF